MPLGTRKLGFARQNPLEATRFLIKTGSPPFLHPTVSDREPRPRSPHGGPDASPSGGTHSVFCCQPLPQSPLPGARPEKTVSVRAPWRFILFCQVQNSESLFRRGARGDYPYELELRSGRAGRPYAGQARPKGVLLAIRARKLCKRKPRQNARWACRAAPYRARKPAGHQIRDDDPHKAPKKTKNPPPKPRPNTWNTPGFHYLCFP